MPISKERHIENEKFQRELLIAELKKEGSAKSKAHAAALEADADFSMVEGEYATRNIKGIALALEDTRKKIAELAELAG